MSVGLSEIMWVYNDHCERRAFINSWDAKRYLTNVSARSNGLFSLWSLLSVIMSSSSSLTLWEERLNCQVGYNSLMTIWISYRSTVSFSYWSLFSLITACTWGHSHKRTERDQKYMLLHEAYFCFCHFLPIQPISKITKGANRKWAFDLFSSRALRVFRVI